MPSGSVSIDVAATPEAAFAVVADMTQAPRWVPDLVSVTKVTDGPVAVGTRYTEVVQMGDKQGDGELWVTVHEPPRVYAHDGQGGPARFSARFTIEPAGDGCRVVHDYEVKLTGMARLMAPLMSKWVEKNSRAAMDNLKRLIEQGG